MIGNSQTTCPVRHSVPLWELLPEHHHQPNCRVEGWIDFIQQQKKKDRLCCFIVFFTFLHHANASQYLHLWDLPWQETSEKSCACAFTCFPLSVSQTQTHYDSSSEVHSHTSLIYSHNRHCRLFNLMAQQCLLLPDQQHRTKVWKTRWGDRLFCWEDTPPRPPTHPTTLWQP